MSKQMIFGLVALGGFVVLGAGLYQLGGKDNEGKDVPLQLAQDTSKTLKPGKPEEKKPAAKGNESPGRDRKPIERKGRDKERPATEPNRNASKSDASTGGPSSSTPPLGKSLTKTEELANIPSAKDFDPASTPATGDPTASDRRSLKSDENVGPPAGSDAEDQRLSALLNSAQPLTEEKSASSKEGNTTTGADPAKDAKDSTEKKASADSATDVPGTTKYRVSRGDTLALISEIHYGSQKHVDRILAANPQIKDPDKVAIGMELRIVLLSAPFPTAAVTKEEKNKPESSDSTKAPANSAKDKTTTEETYLVQDGDTLYSIAQRLYGDGSKWEQLFELNKAAIGAEPSELKMGQKLKLPASPKKNSEAAKKN